MAQPSTFKQVELSDDVAARVVRGDTEAISCAYGLMSQAVMNLAYRMLSDRGMAEEVLQDTFVDLLEKSTQIQASGAIVAWVRSVAVNHCLMKLRSPWHARRQGGADDDYFEQQAGLSTSMGDISSSAVLESAMATLTPDSRAVLWLHEVEGYTHKEIGQLMGKTPSFSKSQLARAYTRLMGWRETLQRNNQQTSDKPSNVVNLARCE